MGSIFFPLIVAPFKMWLSQRRNKTPTVKELVHWYGYEHTCTKDVCPFLAYYLTEFDQQTLKNLNDLTISHVFTVYHIIMYFAVSYFGDICLYRQ